MTREELIRKVTSRKFLLAAAAFLGSLGMGLAGVVDAGVCAVCMALSAAIYSACEAYVDGKSVASTQTVIQASTNDKATVARILAPTEEVKDA
jgi:hypothetical protein